MYPRGSPNAYSASNRVRDFELGIDKDFFRSLVSMRTSRILLANKIAGTAYCHFEDRVMVTLAEADFVGSAALSAVTVTVFGEGIVDGAL
jgi:hypothetical protein